MLDRSPEAKMARYSKALEMRQKGMTYEAIAKALGYSNGAGARYAVKKATDAHVPVSMAEDWRAQLARVDALLSALWPAANEGDPASVNAVTRLEERRVKILTAMGVPQGEAQEASEAAFRGPEADEGPGGPGGGAGGAGGGTVTGLSDFERRLKERDAAPGARSS